MKSLYQSLLDYEMALLKAIANCREIPITSYNKNEMVQKLAEALLSPAGVAIAIAELSKTEREALQLIVNNGGQIKQHLFARQYGFIRPMGAARLEREKPWRTAINVAEKLWYQGFIFKAFEITEQGNLEVVYIPNDLLPILNLPTTKKPIQKESPEHRLKTSSPPLIISGEDRLKENIFNMLVYLRSMPVRLQHNGKLADKNRKELLKYILPPLLPDFTLEAELDFMLHLTQRTGLLTVKYGCIKPNPNTAKIWLQKEHKRLFLQNSWRADPTWNDLWHTPTLVLQPTGWENSPLLARSKILAFLEQIGAEAGDWLSLDDFVMMIKQADPDFQRPNGDYNSWYIYDTENKPLMGFSHWEQVEGSLIRYIISHLLLLLGVVKIGLDSKGGRPVSFALTPTGQTFLTGSELAASSIAKKQKFLRIDDNLYIYVPKEANLYDRFQLARFAELARQEKKQTVYHITRTSVNHARRNGVTAEQIIAFLTRATNSHTPLKVVEIIRTWNARYNTVKLEATTLLRLKYENLAAKLHQNHNISPLLGETISPTIIAVPTKNVPAIRQLLKELGYLE